MTFTYFIFEVIAVALGMAIYYGAVELLKAAFWD